MTVSDEELGRYADEGPIVGGPKYRMAVELQQLRASLATMAERAEKAEAEVARLNKVNNEIREIFFGTNLRNKAGTE